jgi:hypothetical protein
VYCGGSLPESFVVKKPQLFPALLFCVAWKKGEKCILQTYISIVSDVSEICYMCFRWYCKSRSACCICCNSCTRMSQASPVFHLYFRIMLQVCLSGCCIWHTYIASLLSECCVSLQWFSSVFRCFFVSISEACFKCFIWHILQVSHLSVSKVYRILHMRYAWDAGGPRAVPAHNLTAWATLRHMKCRRWRRGCTRNGVQHGRSDAGVPSRR